MYMYAVYCPVKVICTCGIYELVNSPGCSGMVFPGLLTGNNGKLLGYLLEVMVLNFTDQGFRLQG